MPKRFPAAYRNEQVDGGYITGYLRGSLTLNGPNILGRKRYEYRHCERLTRVFKNLSLFDNAALVWCSVNQQAIKANAGSGCPTCYRRMA